MSWMTRISYTPHEGTRHTLLSVEFDESMFTHLANEDRKRAAIVLMKTAAMLLECCEGEIE